MTEKHTTSWPLKQPMPYLAAYRLMQTVVASMPEGYIYARPGHGTANEWISCVYWHSDENRPGCAIGRLLHEMGAPSELLECLDTSPRGGTLDRIIECGLLPGVFEPDAAAALRYFQMHQDNGVAWFKCLEMMNHFHAGFEVAERRNAEPTVVV